MGRESRLRVRAAGLRKRSSWWRRLRWSGWLGGMLGLALLIITTMGMRGSSPIRLSTSPRACMAPCEVKLLIHIEPLASNEAVLLDFVGENYSRSSELPIIAPLGEVSWEIHYKAVPTGSYMIQAQLRRHDGKTWIAGEATSSVEVAGPASYKGKR